MKILDRIKNIVISRKRFFNNKYSLTLLIIALLINLASWLYIFLYIKPQSEPIFLHYNIYYGVDLIGNWYQIYLYIPFIALVVYFINAFISYILYRRDIKLTFLIQGINIFLQISILASTYLIVKQNL
ncbi:MAG: hypothetical protein Q8P20_02900 [bacterium]|nr:hypothetical protein [bacterium]